MFGGAGFPPRHTWFMARERFMSTGITPSRQCALETGQHESIRSTPKKIQRDDERIKSGSCEGGRRLVRPKRRPGMQAVHRLQLLLHWACCAGDSPMWASFRRKSFWKMPRFRQLCNAKVDDLAAICSYVRVLNSHFCRTAVHWPSARPSTFTRPFAASPSTHPANVAVTVPGWPCHVPPKASST